MTLLLMEFRDKPSEAPALLIVAMSAATERRGPPIVKSSKKPNVRSLARERKSGWTARQKRRGPFIFIIIKFSVYSLRTIILQRAVRRLILHQVIDFILKFCISNLL